MAIRPKLLEAISNADADERNAIISAAIERFGLEMVEAQVAMTLRRSQGKQSPFSRGFCRASKLPESKAYDRLWFGMYPGTVALLVGDTGVGKSTLLYGFAVAATSGKPYYDIPFGVNRPLNILYLDPENAGSVENNDGGNCRLKLDRIGQGQPDRLVFFDAADVDLGDPEQLAELQAIIADPRLIPGNEDWEFGAFDIVILDPLANLYIIEDENNNSMAAKRIKELLKIAKRTNACILLVHHESPKSGTAGSGYGRGATATLAAVDSAYAIRAREQTEDVDDDVGAGSGVQRTGMIRWQLVKNRRGGRGSIYLEMLGYDAFDRRDFAAWKNAGSDDASMPKSAKCKEEIHLYLMDGKKHSGAEIMSAMIQEKFSENAAKTALRGMVDTGMVSKVTENRVSYYYLTEVANSKDTVSAPAPRTQRGSKRPVSEYEDADDGYYEMPYKKGTGREAPF